MKNLVITTFQRELTPVLSNDTSNGDIRGEFYV